MLRSRSGTANKTDPASAVTDHSARGEARMFDRARTATRAKTTVTTVVQASVGPCAHQTATDPIQPRRSVTTSANTSHFKAPRAVESKLDGRVTVTAVDVMLPIGSPFQRGVSRQRLPVSVPLI